MAKLDPFSYLDSTIENLGKESGKDDNLAVTHIIELEAEPTAVKELTMAEQRELIREELEKAQNLSPELSMTR